MPGHMHYPSLKYQGPRRKRGTQKRMEWRKEKCVQGNSKAVRMDSKSIRGALCVFFPSNPTTAGRLTCRYIDDTGTHPRCSKMHKPYCTPTLGPYTCRQFYYHPPLTDGKTEAHRGSIIRPVKGWGEGRQRQL